MRSTTCPPSGRPLAPVALVLAVAGAAAALAGCASPKGADPTAKAGRSEPITWADFAATDAGDPRTRPTPAQPDDASDADRLTSLPADPGSAATDDLLLSTPPVRAPRVVDVTPLLDVAAPVAPGGPARPSDARSSAPTVVLESKVGQINGRPVLASEILEPLDGRLRALAIQVTDPAQWRAAATDLIAQQLLSRIRDELVLAEAQSNLTAEQRQGLFFFLGQLQQNLVSSEGGSALQADESLRATTGRGLAEEARDRLDRELIENEIRTKVAPRVNISWRQVRQEYERREEQFKPNPTVTFSMIRASTANAEAVERLTRSLSNASTEAFLAAAAGPDNEFQRDNQGRISLEIRGPLPEAQILASETLNNAARGLQPGQTAGPLNSRPDRVEWIHFVKIDQPASVALYDAQLEIESALRTRRFNAEMSRYYERLFSRGSFSNIEQMGRLLVDIAVQRYSPQGPG